MSRWSIALTMFLTCAGFFVIGGLWAFRCDLIGHDWERTYDESFRSCARCGRRD